MGKYSVGYIPGTFDMFHIGHLNLIKRAKELCDYLVVGVCSDELIEFYKRHKPCISYEDRKEIVAAIKYVDEVICVNMNNSDKIAAWKQIHYDAHFCGDDHIDHWNYERDYLKQYGVEFVFFPYTQGISTSLLRKNMGIIDTDERKVSSYEDIFKISKNKRLVCFGAGAYFQKFMRMAQDIKPYLVLDNNQALWGKRIDGVEIKSPLSYKDNQDNCILICLSDSIEVEMQLQKMGIVNYYIFV